METPLADFVRAYKNAQPLRLHMPGHKGYSLLGLEELDITEIDGADVLYSENGILLESQKHAASLFHAAETVYSTEGSSLCIRTMLYLAMLYGKQTGKSLTILAGRNAHKVLMNAAALLDISIEWLYPTASDGLLSCTITAQRLEAALSAMPVLPSAVYITSPDYLGNITDIAPLSAVCRKFGVLLLVDNAHGAYLRFLPQSLHPMDLGTDMCCDSAHKTLPVLTGGSYLHISENAPVFLREHCREAMSLFASTSPSYLILQSLDLANKFLTDTFPKELAPFIQAAAEMGARLSKHGYTLLGNEPLKLTIHAKPYGYTGTALGMELRKTGIIHEFADPDYLVCMLSPSIGMEGLVQLEKALSDIPPRASIQGTLPSSAPAVVHLSPREALFSLRQVLPVEECEGKILASAAVSCPPAVPIVVCGEEIDKIAIEMFRYYGITHCAVVT